MLIYFFIVIIAGWLQYQMWCSTKGMHSMRKFIQNVLLFKLNDSGNVKSETYAIVHIELLNRLYFKNDVK